MDREIGRLTPMNKRVEYLIFFDRTHPLADKQGRVYYHRHVASINLGRWIGPDEVVHHVNRDRLDNRPENIEVMSKDDHYKAHGRLGHRKCLRCGEIFRAENNRRKYCSLSCSRVNSKRFETTKDELQRLVWEMPVLRVAELFGVSDVAVHKRCKKLGVEKPPIGHWNS